VLDVVNFAKDWVKDFFNKIILMVKNLYDNNLLHNVKIIAHLST